MTNKMQALTGAPAAKGLFEKAIVQSGSRVDPVVDEASSRKVAELARAGNTLCEFGTIILNKVGDLPDDNKNAWLPDMSLSGSPVNQQ